MAKEDFKKVILNHGCEPIFGGDINEDLAWSHPTLPIINTFDPFKMHVKGVDKDIIPQSHEWLDNVLTVMEIMTA